MAETRLYCERHDDLAAPLGLCCHAAQEYNLARDDGDEFDHWSECRMVKRVLSVPGELVDPADLDYEAAARRLEQKQTVARGRFRLDEADAADIVDAALGVGEPGEGNERWS